MTQRKPAGVSWESWVERLEGLFGKRADVYAYFNNDGRACAIRDAIVFARLAGSQSSATQCIARSCAPKPRLPWRCSFLG